jgi:hypothetical protein
MKRVQISDNFYLDEFIDPIIYGKLGQRSLGFIDKRMIEAAEYIRNGMGSPLVINNWATGGQYRESGLRRYETRTGASMSQHKFGRAIDIKVKGYTPKQVHDFILKNERYLIQSQIITTLENHAFTPTWTHLDCRLTMLQKILIVNP